MMTARMLIQRLEMLDGACEVFLAGEDGELMDVLHVEHGAVVLLGAINEDDESDDSEEDDDDDDV